MFPTFIFYQEYLLWKNGLKAFLFSRDKTYPLFGLSALTSVRAIMKPFSSKLHKNILITQLTFKKTTSDFKLLENKKTIDKSNLKRYKNHWVLGQIIHKDCVKLI